jgi:hypothetical protein
MLVSLAILASSTVCLAQTSASRTPAPPTAAAQNILNAGDVYLPGSRVYVLVGKTGLGHEHGVEGQLKQGRINLKSAGAPGSLVFDMASFSVDTPEARKFVGLQKSAESATQQEQVTRNMRGDSVLDVAKFPAASFTIKQIKKLDKPSQRNLPRIQLDGDFSLHGVTRPIQVVTEVEEKSGWTHLMGGFALLQSQFGITPFKKAFGAVGVTDQLSVWGDLWISKQRQIAERPPAAR